MVCNCDPAALDCEVLSEIGEVGEHLSCWSDPKLSHTDPARIVSHTDVMLVMSLLLRAILRLHGLVDHVGREELDDCSAFLGSALS